MRLCIHPKVPQFPLSTAPPPKRTFLRSLSWYGEEEEAARQTPAFVLDTGHSSPGVRYALTVFRQEQTAHTDDYRIPVRKIFYSDIHTANPTLDSNSLLRALDERKFRRCADERLVSDQRLAFPLP
jgi:hypothetical protein